MSNWTDYVKEYAIQHGISYGEALRKAAPSYRRGGCSGGVVLGGKKRRSKRSKSKVSRKSIGGSKKSRRSPPSKKVKRTRKSTVVKSFCRKKPIHKKAYSVGKGLGEMFGGANKGALAALLAGLDASVKIR